MIGAVLKGFTLEHQPNVSLALVEGHDRAGVAEAGATHAGLAHQPPDQSSASRAAHQPLDVIDERMASALVVSSYLRVGLVVVVKRMCCHGCNGRCAVNSYALTAALA